MLLDYCLAKSYTRLVAARGISSVPFRVVRLNGLIQTDDLSAMREIASQLTVDLADLDKEGDLDQNNNQQGGQQGQQGQGERAKELCGAGELC